jgi:hypothetical protein
LLLFVLLAGATISATAGPATAHTCVTAARAPVGQSSTITLVAAVEKEIPDIAFTLPAGLALDRVDPKPGWKATRAGSTVRYQGGPTAPLSCERFSVSVTPARRGVYGIVAVQRDANGTVVARSTPVPGAAHVDPAEQRVYAGVEPAAPPSQTGGRSPLLYVAGGLILLAFAMMTFLFYRNRRIAREDELADRVEEFKVRTRERPPPE